MQQRPEQRPGEWKEKVNQAGPTVFVLPELVPGTVREAFERILALVDPLARVLMTMFVVCEVHPFIDGIGRRETFRGRHDTQSVLVSQVRLRVPRDPLRARLSACHAFEEDVKRYRVVFPERPGWMLAGIICGPGFGMRRSDLHNRAAARPLLGRLKTDQHTVLDLDSGADLH